MARYVGGLVTPHSPGETFDYLADFSSVAEWDPSVSEARLLDGDPRRAGARFAVKLDFLGRERTMLYRTLEAERPNRVVLRAEAGAAVSRDVIEFTPIAGGTYISYEANLELKWPLRLFDPLFEPIFRRYAERGREGLVRVLGGPQAALEPALA